MEMISNQSSRPSPQSENAASGADPERYSTAFDFGDEPGADPDPGQAKGPEDLPPDQAAVYIGKDQFFGMFRAIFQAPNAYILLKGGEPLVSLEIDPKDPQARAASDAIYDILWEIPALRWILELEGEWTKRLSAIGLFLVGRFLLIRAELMARQKIAASSSSSSSTEEDPAPDLTRPADPPPGEAPGVDQGIVELKVAS